MSKFYFFIIIFLIPISLVKAQTKKYNDNVQVPLTIKYIPSHSELSSLPPIVSYSSTTGFWDQYATVDTSNGNTIIGGANPNGDNGTIDFSNAEPYNPSWNNFWVWLVTNNGGYVRYNRINFDGINGVDSIQVWWQIHGTSTNDQSGTRWFVDINGNRYNAPDTLDSHNWQLWNWQPPNSYWNFNSSNNYIKIGLQDTSSTQIAVNRIYVYVYGAVSVNSQPTLKIISGNINGSNINYESPIELLPSQEISGQVILEADNNKWPSNAVVPLAGTPSWGDHSNSYWGINPSLPTGISYDTTSINLSAPDSTGTYYIFFAFSGELSYANVMSLTSWEYSGGNVWNDGHDVADWDESQATFADDSGYVNSEDLGKSGTYVVDKVPATAIKLKVISKPVVRTIGAINISQTSVVLNGTVEPNGLSTIVQFEYGTTTDYGNTVTAVQSPVNGDSGINVSADITGLTPNTLYHYRVKATNSAGTSYGADSVFTTSLSTIKLISPAEGTIIKTWIINFSWGDVANATSYRLNVRSDKNIGQAGGFLWADSIHSKNYSFDFSFINKTYLGSTLYWGVQPVDSNGVGGNWSEIGSFIYDPQNSIIITSPKGGENWQAGSTKNITWTNNGVTDIKIEYTTNNESTWSTVVSSVSASTGGYNWTVPNTPSTQCKISISDVNNSAIGDTSKGFFTITALTKKPTATTQSASNIGETTATLNGTVNPNNLSTIVKFVYGVSISYGDTVTASPNPVTGSITVNVNVGITNLTPGQTYHYKLIAISSAGMTVGNDSIFQTSSIASNKPTVTTNSAGNTAQTTATLSGTVNPNGVSTIIQFDYGTTSKYGSTVTASQSPATGNNNVNVSANISGLTQNTLYHYRLEATNSAGTGYGSDMTFKTKFYYPTSVTLTQSYSFSDPTQSTSYKLIGLPGNLNATLSQMFGGTAKQDWDAYYDNGNTSNYLVEYDNSSTFTFKPGNGFWIISKNPINISQSVSTVTLNSSNSYSISLHSGWNIISNPFDKSVVWDSVVAINTITLNPYIYAWNAGWDSSYYSFTTFDPYKGYYFYNAPENHLSSLEIPYDPNGVAGKKMDKISPLFNINGSQSLKLSLDTNKKEKSFVIITIDSTSSNDFDADDILAPPSDFEDVGINILNKNISLDYKKLLKESRPGIGEGQTFILQIKNTLNQRAYLEVTGQDNFYGYNIYFVDSLNHRFYNLKQQNNIPIIPSKHIENYEVLIGDNQFIQTKEKEMLPKNFWLAQNYPNPFNPTTTIEYSIPEESYVTLRVYDITGRLIRTLVNEERTPGYYEVSFNGENLASGVYFYRIEAQSKASGKSFAKAGKMVLLK